MSRPYDLNDRVRRVIQRQAPPGQRLWQASGQDSLLDPDEYRLVAGQEPRTETQSWPGTRPGR